jgi:hypothetical protein
VITPTSGGTGTPTAGQAYSLNCSLTGITDASVTYQWFKGLASNGTQVANISQLQFSPLRASDAGPYTCRATLNSVEIEETATVTTNRKCIILMPYHSSVIFCYKYSVIDYAWDYIS